MAYNSVINQAVVRAVAEQPWVQRRKDTIVTVLSGVVWALGLITPHLTELPAWVGILVGIVGTLVGAGINALTPGAITPSMSQRLADAAPSLPPKAGEDSDLPAGASFTDKQRHHLAEHTTD